MFMLVIAGTKVEENRLDSGTFNCPNENSKQSYIHIRLEKKATAFFVPVAKMTDIGEYVECQSCGVTYEPAVLQIRTQEEIETALAVAIIRLAIEVILADGIVKDEERQAVINVANQYLDPPGLSLEDLSEMIIPEQLNSTKKRSMRTAHALAELGSALNMDGRRSFVEIAYYLAASDGEVVETEKEVIKKLARRLGFTKSETAEIIAALDQMV